MCGRHAYLNLNRILACTLAEGPGKRFCLWTQGCKRRCVGCCNADMLAIEPRHLVSVDELCRQIANSKTENDIEGVTFLGGEPMLQAPNLSSVARFAKDIRLSVMVFTGYTHAECISGRIGGARDLLAYVDILVDGPFVRAQIDDSRNWVGSRNQKFIYLTDRYSSEIEVDSRLRRIVEVRSEDGDLFWNGDPHVVQSVLGRQCCDDSASAVCLKDR